MFALQRVLRRRGLRVRRDLKSILIALRIAAVTGLCTGGLRVLRQDSCTSICSLG